MKKIFSISLIFVASMFFFFSGSSVNAQDDTADCECAYNDQLDQCVSSYGTVSYDNCGPGWKCQCGSPTNYRENCGDYGCFGVADCGRGICVQESAPAGSQCSAGDTVLWKVNPNECRSPSYLSGQQRSRPAGRTTMTESECCTPHLNPTPDPTRIPAGTGQTIPVYDPTCASGGPYGINYGGVKTALGCLPTDPQAFINTATPWAVGIGAGIAFLLGIFGAVMIVLSAGNPEKMQAGKEMITSAIGGLILIVFSVFLLRIIGVDVLKLF